LEEEVRPKDLRSPVNRVLSAEEERAIITLAGQVAEDACCDDDARHFYRLAEDWMALVELECSIAASALLRTPTADECAEMVSQGVQTYDTIRQNALQTYNCAIEGGFPVHPDRLEALRLFVELLWCVVLLEGENWDQIIAQMEGLDLFPPARSQIPLYRERLRRLPEGVRACLGSMAGLMITAYRRAYEEAKPDDQANARVDALITFLPDLDVLSEHLRIVTEGASGFHIFAVDT
jgi:hypothetical protein